MKSRPALWLQSVADVRRNNGRSPDKEDVALPYFARKAVAYVCKRFDKI